MKHIEQISVSGKLKITLRDVVSGKITKEYEYKNLNPTIMKTMIANNLVEDIPDNNMAINYVAVGTGTSSPLLTNTQLQTEIYRNIVATKNNDHNVIYITGFFQDTEVSGDLKEIGLFSGGTATVNTGILVSRVAINVNKSTSESLTVDWIITIS